MRNKRTLEENSSIRITPCSYWRVHKVKPLENYRLYVSFLDGTEGEVDLSILVNSSKAGVFSILRDETVFQKVFIDLGVVTWPGEIDLAPDAMYQSIRKNGEWILES